jgi:two-component system NtrC family response regulator
MAKVLLIDDDAGLREVVAFILGEAGHEVVAAADGEEGLRRLAADRPDLVLTDIRMPGRDGLDVLQQVRAAPDAPPVIVLTAFGSVEQAVEAMKAGAFSYLLKPFKRDELRLTVEQALRGRELEAENRRLRDLLRQRRDALPIVHASAAMERVVEQVRRVAPTDVSVLVTGESGTGKELVARALHDLSPRWDRPFVAVNCGAIPAELMESELFGHARGAFTGAVGAAPGRVRAAAGGTLFLDEIGELPLALQPKLLRVLETKQVDPVGGPRPVAVDFRLVAATNRDLAAQVRAGRFREDLYYRIAVLAVHVPPLRERPEDVDLLWAHFTHEHGGAGVMSTPALLQRLRERPWPGNVRELLNLNLRLLVMRRGDTLDVADLERAESAAGAVGAFAPGAAAAPAAAADAGAGPRAGSRDGSRDDGDSAGAGLAAPPGVAALVGPLPEGGLSLPDLERELIRRALAKFGGNRTKAAAYLGIPRHVLVYRLEKYGLP